MAPKGGMFFLLLVGAFAALVSAQEDMIALNQAATRRMAQKLMLYCRKEGYPLPDKTAMASIFLSEMPANIRDFMLEDDPLLSVLDNVLGSVPLLDIGRPERAARMTWNYTTLPGIVKRMMNYNNDSKCYMKAFLAPMAWAAMKSLPDRGMTLEDYKAMLWAAKPALLSLPPKRMRLPSVTAPRMKAIMSMLRDEFEELNQNQRKQLMRWMRTQVVENLFNCSLDTSSVSPPPCRPSTEWLTAEVLELMGQYAFLLPPRFVDAIPALELMELYREGDLKEALSDVRRLNPRLGQRLFQKIRENANPRKFFYSLNKLGKLACFFNISEARILDLNSSKILLSQLDDCRNPSAKRLRRILLRTLFSESPNATDTLLDLGSSITLLSPRQLAKIPTSNITEVLRSLGPNVRWSKAQLRVLLRKILRGRRCNEVSVRELQQLESLMDGLPNCMMRVIRPQDILDNAGALRNMTRGMKRRQLKAILQKLGRTMNISSVINQLPGPLLRSVSLSNLRNADLSFEQVQEQTWTLQQAALLARQMYNRKKLRFRGLKSLLQGITCKMMEEASETELQELTQAMEESPEWLSRAQVSCAAHKLFALLEAQSATFFSDLTEGDLISIPTNLLLYLPAKKVKNLPMEVCDAFLDKMETADLDVLPARAPSRAAFAMKALQCLTRAVNESDLTADDVSRLGPLVCELPPAKLGLLSSEVLNSTLQSMPACENIPRAHRQGIVQLVKQIYGNPSEWSADMMEMLGPLVLLDDSSVYSLPNKPWMKDVLYFLKSRLIAISRALQRKFFELTLLNTDTEVIPEPVSRARRATTGKIQTRTSNLTDVTPTLEMIQELGENNVFWTAQQLSSIPADIFISAVEILGDISDFEDDQIAALALKAVEAFGAVQDMDDTTVAQIGCIAQGFPDSDLEKLSISMDGLDEFEECNWNVSQMTPLWTGIAAYNNLTAATLESSDLVALDLFLCGLNATEIEQLSPEVFKDALGSMDGLACSYDVQQMLKDVALEAYGDPSTWTEADVAELGNMIAGLSPEELAMMDPSLFSFVPESAIVLIPSGNFAALSIEQLLSLGPDNAAALTEDQLSSLSEEQTSALEQAMSGEREQPGHNSAPSVGLTGMWALVRTFVLLFSCFLLL